MVLDRRFFTHTATTPYNNDTFILESYKAVYARSTMVLFSRKTKTPLAALTFKANDVGCLSMLTGRPTPNGAGEPYFQGMLNIPDQDFEFAISNLSPKGMINFNILHTPHRISAVDPGPAFGVNQVNELHPNQSYVINADQRTNRQMILAGKTKSMGATTVPVSVKETEAEEKPSGLYFFLGVVPDQACQEMVDKFKEGTVWKVVPGFVRQVANPVATMMRANTARQEQVQRLRSRARMALRASNTAMPRPAVRSDVFMMDSPSRSPLGSASGSPRISFGAIPASVASPAPPGAAPAARRIGPSSFDYPRIDDDCPQWVPPPHPPFAFETDSAASESPNRMRSTKRSWGEPTAFLNSSRPAQNDDNDDDMNSLDPPSRDCALSPSSAPRMASSQEKQRRRRLINADANADAFYSCATGAIDSPAYSPASSPSSPSSLLSEGTNGFSQEVDVGKTQAGELRYGQQVDVSSRYTGHDYAYEHCSEPAVLCLSIWEGMKFLGLPDVEKELQEEVQEWIQHEGKSLVESLNAVYKAESCVVDLESEADTIICTCGHQCVNHKNIGNLRKCPMCRASVSAFVRADGIVLG